MTVQDAFSYGLQDFKNTLDNLIELRKELQSESEKDVARKVLILCPDHLIDKYGRIKKTPKGKGSKEDYMQAIMSCKRYLNYIKSHLRYSDEIFMAIAPKEKDEGVMTALQEEMKNETYDLIISIGREVTEWLLETDFSSDAEFKVTCKSILERNYSSPKLSYRHSVVPMLPPSMLKDDDDCIDSLACSFTAMRA